MARVPSVLALGCAAAKICWARTAAAGSLRKLKLTWATWLAIAGSGFFATFRYRFHASEAAVKLVIASSLTVGGCVGLLGSGWETPLWPARSSYRVRFMSACSFCGSFLSTAFAWFIWLS